MFREFPARSHSGSSLFALHACDHSKGTCWNFTHLIKLLYVFHPSSCHALIVNGRNWPVLARFLDQQEQQDSFNFNTITTSSTLIFATLTHTPLQIEFKSPRFISKLQLSFLNYLRLASFSKMHPLKPLILVGISAAAATAE